MGLAKVDIKLVPMVAILKLAEIVYLMNNKIKYKNWLIFLHIQLCWRLLQSLVMLKCYYDIKI